MTITIEHVDERLAAHGYEVVRHTADHVVYEHHGDRVVVPRHSSELSPWAGRVIEWSLAPRLGPGWLADPEPNKVDRTAAPPLTTSGALRLDLVVRPEPDRSAWNAFVAEEPRILTFGTTIDETISRAGDAAAAWYGQAVPVRLVPTFQLGRAIQAWIEAATEPTPSPILVAEARDHLLSLGFALVDVEVLLAGSPTNVAPPARAQAC